MKITLKKLTLVNFQGAKHQEIEFAEITNISGANRTGKTTIFDGFLWLTTGKDSEDRKDFGVKTWDESGNIIQKIDHEVTGILDIDGVETKLSRILKENWVKARGTEEAVFEGNKTYFFINDVPKTQAEFQSFISGIIPEATFKLLTSPTYFSSLKWDVRREMLISICGTPTDQEIAGNDLISLLQLFQTEKKTVEELKKEYAFKRKNLKDALDKIPTRIDENNRDTPEPKDFAKIEAALNQKKHNLGLIEGEILDLSKGTEEAVRIRSEKLIEKSNIETKLSRLENEARNQFANAGNTKDSEIKTKQQRILSLKQNILNYESDNKSYQVRIDNHLKSNQELKAKYEARNAETLEFNASLNCPTCGQSMPDDLVEHQETEAVNKFNTSKVNDLNGIVQQATTNKKLIAELQVSIDANIKHISELQAEIDLYSKEIETLQNTPVHTKSVEGILSEKPEYLELKSQIEAIVIPEIVPAPDSTSLKIKKVEIIEAIRSLEEALRIKDRIAEKTKRKAEIEAEGKQLGQQIADLEKIEFQIETFNKRKMTSVESRVNALFPTLKFRMFNQTIEGNDVPACDCLVNGVPWPKANTANRINAGIEIINVFSKVHNCFAPVFVDNAESINTVIPTQSQLIRLIVTDENKLTVRV